MDSQILSKVIITLLLHAIFNRNDFCVCEKPTSFQPTVLKSWVFREFVAVYLQISTVWNFNFVLICIFVSFHQLFSVTCYQAVLYNTHLL